MTMLRRVGRNVSDLENLGTFYIDGLGFKPAGPAVVDPKLAATLGVSHVKTRRFQLGQQELDLTECHENGAPYPLPGRADDLIFQHIAIVTTDIFTMYGRAKHAGAEPISMNGPQRLPIAAGGVIAWKFRDPDGHPLEFLQFPTDGDWHGAALTLGYDHSAISVSNTEASIAFYEGIGLQFQQRQVNHGLEQDQLDGLDHVKVDVVAMAAAGAPPHLELLGYHGQNSQRRQLRPHDLAADRLVFDTGDAALRLLQDPDGHFILFDGRT